MLRSGLSPSLDSTKQKDTVYEQPEGSGMIERHVSLCNVSLQEEHLQTED